MRGTLGQLAARPILSEAQRLSLHAIAKACPIERILNDKRHFEEWMVDFVYTSAKIAGNAYDRIDVDNLVRFGVTAGGKRYSEATMLVNLRKGFSIAMRADAKTRLDGEYLCDVHKALMTDLLPENQLGIFRGGPMTIGERYRQIQSPMRSQENLEVLFAESEKYTDPFERAIHLQCNLVSIRVFNDGNKRAARLMQTAALVRSGITPLFFRDTLVAQYHRAIEIYCETGEYEPYADFFVTSYAMVAALMLGKDDFYHGT